MVYRDLKLNFRDFKNLKYSNGFGPDFSDLKSGFMDFRPNFRLNLKAFRPYCRDFTSDFKDFMNFTLDFKVFKPDFRDFWSDHGLHGFQGF